MRSPNKNKDRMDKIDMLTGMIKELMKDTKEIRADQKNYQEELKQIRRENGKLKEENENIRKEANVMKTRIERLEKDRIKNNIIVTGMQWESKDRKKLKDEVESFIKEKIGNQVRIKDALRIGPRTYKVEMENMFEKIEVMRNKGRLKELEQKIFIDSELTKNELEIQRKIRQVTEGEKQKGKKVKIGYRKAVIDGKEWQWENDKDMLMIKERSNGVQREVTKN